MARFNEMPGGGAARARGIQDQGGQKYIVQPGDTLSSISERFYGDPKDYMLIFYANQDKIRKPDDELYPGQEFLIPPAPSKQESA